MGGAFLLDQTNKFWEEINMKVKGKNVLSYEFEDEIYYDWETFEFKNHETPILVKNGGYYEKSKTVSDLFAVVLGLNNDYDEYPQKNNKIRVKCRDGLLQIERIK